MKKLLVFGCSLFLLLLILLGAFVLFKKPSAPEEFARPEPSAVVNKDFHFLWENQIAYSSDEKSVAFITSTEKGLKGSVIWVLDQLGNLREIKKGSGYSFYSTPVWSPDDKFIAFWQFYPMRIIISDSKGFLTRVVLEDDARLNPSIGYGGISYLKWKNSEELEFIDNTSFPPKYFTVNIYTSKVSNGENKTEEPLKKEFNFVHQSQRDSRWKNDRLGSCENQTIGSAGCAVASVAAMLSAFDSTVNTSLLNTFLKDKELGYANGCDIIWYIVPNYLKGIAFKGLFSYEKSFERLDYNLQAGNLVILGFDKVPSTNIPHWVLVKEKKNGEYIIYDPWDFTLQPRTLKDFGGNFDHLVVYGIT